MLDAKNNPVKVGDEVAWASIAYRSPELRIGEVEKIEPRQYHSSYNGPVEEVATVRSYCTKKIVKRYSSQFVLIN